MKYAKQIILILVLGFCLTNSYAQKNFDFNPACQQAYSAILSLRIADGEKIISQEKVAHPDNLIPYFLDNYADFFSLFFNEDEAEFDRKLPFKSARLDLMKLGSKDSPWTLFTQAILQLQWAAIHIKFGEKWAAGWSMKAANDLIKENQRLFPNFTPNSLVLGPLQMVSGTIPKSYQWLSGIMGLKGNIAQGMQNLTGFMNRKDAMSSIFHDEAVFYTCYLKFYIENKPDEALAIIQQQHLDVVNNQLFTYMAANLSINNQQSANAKDFVLNRNMSPNYLQISIWDFEMAYAKLFHLEPDAVVYFDRFLKNFKGNFYVKDAWLKFGWSYLLQNNLSQYNRCMDQVKTKGNTETDADKKALKDAKSGKIPNVLLLKARLLTDGGYTKEAFQMLVGKSTNDFQNLEDKLEFAYRVGRINEELEHYDNAIDAYLSTIKLGRDRTEYFAARAALEAGMIYETQKKNKQMAIAFYQQCLDLPDHDYKNSLDQKAKSGIARCMGQ